MRNKWIHCAVCRRPAATGGGGGGGIVDTEAIAYALWNPCGAEGAEECHKCNASAVKCHRLRCIGFTRNQYVIVWHWIRCSVAICHGHHSVLWKSHWQILPFCWLWRYSPQCAHSARQIYIFDCEPNDKPKTSIIIFECVAASRRRRFLPTVCRTVHIFRSSSLVTVRSATVIVQLFSNFRYTKTIWPRNLPIESLLDGIAACVCERAYIL